MSITVYTALGAGLALAAGFVYLVRRSRSRSWGLCTLNTNLEGKVVVVTGANVGLGLELVVQLATRGATVVMACRSWENTKDSLKLARDKTGNNDIHYMHLDLASFHSVREFSAELKQAYPAVYSLVCNAGVWYPMDQGRRTEEGHEIHAGINHLGHFLLTNLLLENLEFALPGSRIVMVSSSLMNQAQLDLDNVDHFSQGRQQEKNAKNNFAPTGYCDSKMMNALFARELGSRLGETGVKCVTVCPGWCYTNLARHVKVSFLKKVLFVPFACMFMRSASRGSHNILQAVLEDSDKLVQGGFYRECKIAEAENNKIKNMKEVGGKLWNISEKLVGLEQ